MNGDQINNDVLRAIGTLEGTQKQLIIAFGKVEKKLDVAVSTCLSFEEYKKNRADLPNRILELEKTVDDYKKSIPQREADSKYIADLRMTLRAIIIAAGLTNTIVLALLGLLTWLFHSGYLKAGI